VSKSSQARASEGGSGKASSASTKNLSADASVLGLQATDADKEPVTKTENQPEVSAADAQPTDGKPTPPVRAVAARPAAPAPRISVLMPVSLVEASSETGAAVSSCKDQKDLQATDADKEPVTKTENQPEVSAADAQPTDKSSQARASEGGSGKASSASTKNLSADASVLGRSFDYQRRGASDRARDFRCEGAGSALHY
jgi:hypothetical protein